MPEPEKGCQLEGTVVLDIKVNREGYVIDVQIGRGTTITESCVIEKAKKAAFNSKWSENPNGPEIQSGWIRYKFTF